MQIIPLIMMLATNAVVIGFTAFFFYKVFQSPLDKVDEDESQFPRGG
jgi:ABC-type glucose/galactose transport system permease subunit